MLTDAVGAKISISDMPPLDMISPKNLSVPSTLVSLIIGTVIRVTVSPAGNMMGIALAWVVSVKSAMAKYKRETDSIRCVGIIISVCNFVVCFRVCI